MTNILLTPLIKGSLSRCETISYPCLSIVVAFDVGGMVVFAIIARLCNCDDKQKFGLEFLSASMGH